MKIRRIVTIISIVLFSGCESLGQSDFSCGGPTPGVSCLPATDVYEITNDPELHAAVTAALEAAASSGEEFNAQEVVKQVRNSHRPQIEIVKSMANPVKQPLPVLKPAHVVRIWFDAWIDEKGDLHMPGFIFTEITPRRWSLGEPAVSNSQILAPVQVNRSQVERTQGE